MTKPRYFTHDHNIVGCLQNGSYVRLDKDGGTVQYINGDFMGFIDKIPKGMVEVPPEQAKRLLPKCCR